MKDRDGRNANGQFGKHNKFAAGNPRNATSQQLRAILIKACTKEDMEEIARVLISEAKRGNLVAIRELLDRVLGKPQASVEITNPDTPTRIQDMTDEQLMAILQEGKDEAEGEED